MSPELQNLLLMSPAAQQADLDTMPAELREKLEDELAERYRHCLPDFDASIWILRVPKHRFKRLCPSLQDAALRYATPKEHEFLRQHRNSQLGAAIVTCLLFGSCSTGMMAESAAEGRDSEFLEWVASTSVTVFGICLAVIFLFSLVTFLNWLIRP